MLLKNQPQLRPKYNIHSMFTLSKVNESKETIPLDCVARHVQKPNTNTDSVCMINILSKQKLNERSIHKCRLKIVNRYV